MSEHGRARAVIFLISLFAICIELLLTRVMGLKTWSHYVYLVIPFAMLGYGMGSNLYLLLKQRLDEISSSELSIYGLSYSAIGGCLCLILLPILPMNGFFPFALEAPDQVHLASLAVACFLMSIPFIGTGFMTAYLFSARAAESRVLYFWDLLGASAGAALFFPLLPFLGVYRAGLTLCTALLLVALWLARQAQIPLRAVGRTLIPAMLLVGGALQSEEPPFEAQDTGFEKVPEHFSPQAYQVLASQWHALGRTDIFRILDPAARQAIIQQAPLSMSISLDPLPEFAYIATNYRAGTPVYRIDPSSLQRGTLKLAPLKTAMEMPYLLLKQPRVFVIGTGGGRDIVMATANQATRVIGAEVNPFTYASMSAGGAVYEYSGRVYTWPNVQVENVDGRHLIRDQQDQSFDYIVLNGVDTFAALSSGAYSFAESYLYTKEAVQDYLRILDSDGILNFNRYSELRMPRESLRLFLIILESLRTLGIEKPWEHVMIANPGVFAITMVKKSPFTREEQARVMAYAAEQKSKFLYVPSDPLKSNPYFQTLAEHFAAGKEQEFVDAYPLDISSSTDDKPFFYKSYRVFRPESDYFHPGGGIDVFLIQVLLFVVSFVFILLFIFLPLLMSDATRHTLPERHIQSPFVLYFASLGMGFILIEIAMMQKLILLLGNPVYSISVTLAALLVFAGLGSLLLPALERRWPMLSGPRGLAGAAVCLALLLALFNVLAPPVLSVAIGSPLWMRVVIACLLLLPIGCCLGYFFPTGLALVGRAHPRAVPWAWAINCAFTVFGSNLAILLAQLEGFSFVLGLAAVIYLAGAGAYVWLYRALEAHEVIAEDRPAG